MAGRGFPEVHTKGSRKPARRLRRICHPICSHIQGDPVLYVTWTSPFGLDKDHSFGGCVRPFAYAGAAQSLGVDQQQVLACFGTAAALQDSTINIGGGKHAKTATATAGGGGGGSASAAAGGALPDTGGASLIALGAGALLVAGGLLARRIVR